MEQINEFFEFALEKFTELLEFIKQLWDLRTFVIIGIVIFIVFVVFDRMITTVDHCKQVFKGGKKDD